MFYNYYTHRVNMHLNRVLKKLEFSNTNQLIIKTQFLSEIMTVMSFMDQYQNIVV